MMKARKSALDAGLHELATATSGDDMYLAESVTEAPAPVSLPDLGVLETAAAPPARPRMAAPADMVSLKLLTALTSDTDFSARVSALGGEVVSEGPQVLLANIPRAQISALDDIPGLRRAEQPRRLHAKLDQARGAATRCDIAQTEHPGLRGQGVVVGIVDSGVDWRHQDFRNADGTTRLELFMHAVNDAQTGTDTFTEFSEADLNAALAGNGQVPQGDLNGHGTHCCSIAAGNGRASTGRQFRGVAPQATLMGMRTDTLHDTHTIEGIRRIFEAAGDRPAVVNLSLGTHMGPHDGTGALENVIARESGPGRIVVVAAGNEASDRIHFQGQLTMGQDLDITFTIRDDVQFLDVWIARGDEADVEVIDPAGNTMVPDGSIQTLPGGQFRADLREDQFNRDVNLTLAVAGNQLNRRWRLRLTPTAVTQGVVHAWAQTRDANRSRNIFMTTSSQRFTIGMPATEERAIAVGSFISRAGTVPGAAAGPGLGAGQVSPFSSRGPTRHGAQRPDIAAPGQHIVAALAANSSMASSPNLAARRLAGGQYISIQGTSMATPFVTGVIALMLQQEPGLYPEEIHQRLRATAQRDADTSTVWNPEFGYGKIDVQGLLNYDADA